MCSLDHIFTELIATSTVCARPCRPQPMYDSLWVSPFTAFPLSEKWETRRKKMSREKQKNKIKGKSARIELCVFCSVANVCLTVCYIWYPFARLPLPSSHNVRRRSYTSYYYTPYVYCLRVSSRSRARPFCQHQVSLLLLLHILYAIISIIQFRARTPTSSMQKCAAYTDAEYVFAFICTRHRCCLLYLRCREGVTHCTWRQLSLPVPHGLSLRVS